jgi:hypothetical protein
VRWTGYGIRLWKISYSHGRQQKGKAGHALLLLDFLKNLTEKKEMYKILIPKLKLLKKQIFCREYAWTNDSNVGATVLAVPPTPGLNSGGAHRNSYKLSSESLEEETT